MTMHANGVFAKPAWGSGARLACRSVPLDCNGWKFLPTPHCKWVSLGRVGPQSRRLCYWEWPWSIWQLKWSTDYASCLCAGRDILFWRRIWVFILSLPLMRPRTQWLSQWIFKLRTTWFFWWYTLLFSKMYLLNIGLHFVLRSLIMDTHCVVWQCNSALWYHWIMKQFVHTWKVSKLHCNFVTCHPVSVLHEYGIHE